MNVNKHFAPAIAAAGIALTVWTVPAQAATEIRAMACFQRNHDYVQTLHQNFISPINKAGGALKIRYIGGPETTPRQKQAPALKRGLVDMIYCPGAYYGGILAEGRLLGAHNRTIPEVRANGGWDLMQEAWGKGLNARIVAWNFGSGQKFYVYTRFQPKTNTTTGLDLNGVKMRSTGLYKAFMKKMGSTPIVISPGDVYSALERGVVQGIAWPWGSIAKYGWQRFLKFRIEPAFYGATMTLLINKNKWASLSAAGKKQLADQAAAYEKNADAVIIKKGHEDDAKLFKAGIRTIKLEGDVRKAYVRTIYGAKWKENDSLRKKFIVDYDTLKDKLYDPNR